MKFLCKSWVKGLLTSQHITFLLLLFIMTRCVDKGEAITPIPSKECCFNGKCISLRDGYITTLTNSSTSTVTAFQVDLTSGGTGISADRIILLFYSNNLLELSPGKYGWQDFNLHEPNSITDGMLIDMTAHPIDLFGHGSYSQDLHKANGGSVKIEKNGNNTAFTISLLSDNKPLTGYFNGILQQK